MADLERDVARLVKLAYQSVDGAAFLDALPGLASEIKLHVIRG